jgi:hypothetical protein
MKPGSRWSTTGKNLLVPRISNDRTVEHTRFVRQPNGSRRKVTDTPTERVFVERSHEASEWRNGARVRKRS